MSVEISQGHAWSNGGADVDRRFLNPGEFCFSDITGEIHTLLGSCIAITLWHSHLRIGGMCHFVLPNNGMKCDSENVKSPPDGRYADGAMALFEAGAARHGTKLSEYQAKIFGGSNMLNNSTLREDELIGTRNAEAAMMLLAERDIPLLVAHVGETGHRRIILDVRSGDVWVRHEALQKLIPRE